MESLSLLLELQALPSIEEAGELAPAEMMSRVRAMDRDNFAIEVSIAVEEGLGALFDARNVGDHLSTAYGEVFPNAASDHESMYDHYLAMLAKGEASVTGFINPLKGRLAEFEAESVLEERFPGWNFTLARDPTQPDWDLQGIGPEGQEMLVQVKTGAASYVGDVLERMEESPDIAFAVSGNLFAQLTEKAPELSHRLINLDVSNHEFTTEAREGLGTLAANMGIDVPDSIGEVLPYVGEVVLGIKLIHSIVSTERTLRGKALSDRSRVHGVQTLALMTRFGAASVCGMAGAAGGGAAGTSVLPGVGTGVGSLVGGVAGAGFAMALNRKLRPHIEDIAVRLVGGDPDDLFYLMNKLAIDEIGESLAATELGAPARLTPL